MSSSPAQPGRGRPPYLPAAARPSTPAPAPAQRLNGGTAHTTFSSSAGPASRCGSRTGKHTSEPALASTQPVFAHSASLAMTGGPLRGSNTRKLIPSSSHSKQGRWGGKKQRPQAQPSKRTATGGSRSGSSATRSVAANRGDSRGVPPRLSSAGVGARGGGGGGGIAVLAHGGGSEVDGADDQEAERMIPAYLTGVAAAAPCSPACGQQGLGRQRPPSSRPHSALNATLTLSRRPRQCASEERPVLADAGGGAAMASAANPVPQQFTYTVGNAVVNPYVSVSPAVQQSMREVAGESGGSVAYAQPKRSSLTLAALPRSGADATAPRRSAIGATIVPCPPPASGEDKSRASPASTNTETPSMPNFPPVSPTPKQPKGGLSTANEELLLGVISARGDANKPQDFFYIEEISNRKDNAGSTATTGAKANPCQAMQRLKALYGTSSNDVPAPSATTIAVAAAAHRAEVPHSSESCMDASNTVAPTSSFGGRATGFSGDEAGYAHYDAALRETLAKDVLPELLTAEARCAEIAAARRRIDWDVAIPLPGSVAAPPPLPAIAFLDREGSPVGQLGTVHYTFHAATLTMERDVDEDMKSFYVNSKVGPQHTASIAANKVVAAIRTVGQAFSQSRMSPSLFRFHGLVGLMMGLAEKVGLERVMEYQVTCHTDSVMLLSSPYIDADVGDLVVHVNPSLLGSIRLTITGYDCASVEPTSGAIVESSNTLTVVIRCVHTPLAEGSRLPATEPAGTLAATVGGAGGLHRSTHRTNNGALGVLPPPDHAQGHAASTPPPPPPPHAVLSPVNQTPPSVLPSGPPSSFGPGECVSPTSFGLTLASFPRDQESRVLGGALVAGQRTDDDAGACAGRQLEAHADAAATGSVAAPSSYVFPATNPHQLRYMECQQTSREFIFAQIVRARQEAKRERAAQHQHHQQHQQQRHDGGTEGNRQTSPAVTVPSDSCGSDPNRGDSNNNGNGDEDILSDSSLPTAGVVPIFLADDTNDTPPRDTQKHPSRRKGETKGKKGRSHASRHEDSDDAEEELFSEKEQLWRIPTFFVSNFFLGSLQSPLSHMRLATWQDRLTELFRHGNQDLLRSETRSRVKQQAKAELADYVVANLGSASGGSGGAARERRRNAAPYRTSPNTHSSGGSSASATSQQSIALLHRLVLCLLLEENRGSQQLFSDIVELCGHLAHNTLLRTITVTGGTVEGLQNRAAAILAPTPSATSAFAKHRGGDTDDDDGGDGSPTPPDSPAVNLTDKERANLQLLVDMLDVCLTSMVAIGCYAEAVNYATQRVHVQCLLEGDTTDVVYAAQRDLAEVLFFYGDFSASLQIAEDTLMLAEQLYDTDSSEEMEAKILVAVGALFSGKYERTRELVVDLMGLLHKDGNGGGGGGGIPPITQASIRLVYALARPALEHLAPAPSARCKTADEGALSFSVQSAVHALHEAVELLSGAGDLAEMEKSFSTILPATVALKAAAATGGGKAAHTVAVAMAHQKRARWNLLCFAGVLFLQHGEAGRGIGLLENVVQELALGEHRIVERAHRADLSAMLWVVLVVWKIWIKPTEARELLPALRRSVQHLTRNHGPFHPLAAAANLVLADIQKGMPHSHALGLALRSLTALRRCVSPRSSYIRLAHIVCGTLCTMSRRWQASLEHANAALLISQINGTLQAGRTIQEAFLLGALLRCPPTVDVRLRPQLLLKQLEERVTSMERIHGAHDELLAMPLQNLSDAHFILGNHDNALSCLQRALRLVDSKGTLTMSHTVLKPECQLNAAKGDLQRRRLALSSLLQSPARLLTVVDTLFAIGAVLEAKGGDNVAMAQDAYMRSLALLEAASLAGSLASIRVYEALAKSYYSTGAYGDALRWAKQAERAVHATYKAWPHEVVGAKTLVATIQEALYEQEGVFVCTASDGTGGDGMELL